jgi:hypothetical protein
LYGNNFTSTCEQFGDGSPWTSKILTNATFICDVNLTVTVVSISLSNSHPRQLFDIDDTLSSWESVPHVFEKIHEKWEHNLTKTIPGIIGIFTLHLENESLGPKQYLD